MLIAVQNKLTAWFGKRQTGIYIAGHLIELAGSINSFYISITKYFTRITKCNIFYHVFFFGHYNINKGLTYKENQCLIYKPSARLCNWNCHTAKKSEKYNLFILNVLGECIFDKFILGFRDIIQHSGGQVVIWVCVASTAHGYFAVIEVTMNFCVGVCVCIYIHTRDKCEAVCLTAKVCLMQY